MIRKPDSVYDDHLSRRGVTDALKRFSDAAGYRIMSFSLAPSGVYRASRVAAGSVSSYLAFPSLPIKDGRSISVALSFKSP